jgi:hypothetical protein
MNSFRGAKDDYEQSPRRVIYRPKPPISPDGKSWGVGMEHLSGVYRVMQAGELVAVHNPVYFQSIKEVVADLVNVVRTEPDWQDFDDDYVVWCNQSPGERVLAVVQWRAEKRSQRVTIFKEQRQRVRPWPYWPTYEEWVASGRGDLWATDRAEEPPSS